MRDKIVLCDWSGGDWSAACVAGSSGIIMQDGEVKDFARLFPIPTSTFNPNEGDQISLYVNSTRYYMHVYIINYQHLRDAHTSLCYTLKNCELIF